MSATVVQTPVTEYPLQDPFSNLHNTPSTPQPRLHEDLGNVWELLRPLGVTEEVGTDGPVVLRKADDIPHGNLGDFANIWKFLKGIKDGSVILPPTPVGEPKDLGKGKRTKGKGRPSASPRNSADSDSTWRGAKRVRGGSGNQDRKLDSSESEGGRKRKRKRKRSTPKLESENETSEGLCSNAVKKTPSPKPEGESPKSKSKTSKPSASQNSPPCKDENSIAKTSKSNSKARKSKPPPKAKSSPKALRPTQSEPPKRPSLKTTPPISREQHSQTEPIGTQSKDVQSKDVQSKDVQPKDVQSREAFLRATRTKSNSIKKITPSLIVTKKEINAVRLDNGPRKFVTALDSKAREERVLEKLLKNYPQDKETLLKPGAAETREGRPIHVFIDNSNIIVGFFHALKRFCNLPETARTTLPTFDFSTFSLVLERGRPTRTKVLVGSLPSTKSIEKAEELGYSIDLLTRVEKTPIVKVSVEGGSEGGSGGKSPTNGSKPSPSNTKLDDRPKRIEQAVDEIISLKMTLTLLDHSSTPGTLVLASGDAAAGEFSDGFGTIVERFLERGWEVEVVCWKSSCNVRWRDWKDGGWVSRWKGRFRCLFLEEFLEGFLEGEDPEVEVVEGGGRVVEK